MAESMNALSAVMDPMTSDETDASFLKKYAKHQDYQRKVNYFKIAEPDLRGHSLPSLEASEANQQAKGTVLNNGQIVRGLDPAV